MSITFILLERGTLNGGEVGGIFLVSSISWARGQGEAASTLGARQGASKVRRHSLNPLCISMSVAWTVSLTFKNIFTPGYFKHLTAELGPQASQIFLDPKW